MALAQVVVKLPSQISMDQMAAPRVIAFTHSFLTYGTATVATVGIKVVHTGTRTLMQLAAFQSATSACKRKTVPSKANVGLSRIPRHLLHLRLLHLHLHHHRLHRHGNQHRYRSWLIRASVWISWEEIRAMERPYGCGIVTVCRAKLGLSHLMLGQLCTRQILPNALMLVT